MAAETNKVKTEVNNVKNTTKSTVNRVKIAAPYAYVEVTYHYKFFFRSFYGISKIRTTPKIKMLIVVIH